jgi:hypothetical protein
MEESTYPNRLKDLVSTGLVLDGFGTNLVWNQIDSGSKIGRVGNR